MKSGTSPLVRRFVSLAVAGILVVVLAACTGRGGGYLPPQNPVFTGQASFGFTFSCEDKGGVNRQPVQLAYRPTTAAAELLVGSPFGIHGTVDTIDPVLESMYL